MKHEAPKNSNYAAVVVRVPATVELAGCDNVHAVPVFGSQAITQKSVQPGDLMLYFPAEVQLSHEYASANNMYRHSELNADPQIKGYIEDNRRVKAMKFRGHRSDALLMPLSSIDWVSAGIFEPTPLQEGDTFDSLGGHEICRKYVIKEGDGNPKGAKTQLPKTRVDNKFLPEHFDTDNWFRNRHKIGPDEQVTVTQKLHGSSIRVGHVPVARKLSRWERWAKRWFKVSVQETEYDYVFGSRRVIKDANNPETRHLYDSDIWSLKGKELEGILPKGYIIYGELIGWTPDGAAIQAGYTYGVPKGQSELVVYRVVHVNEDGHALDLTWDGVKNFCVALGLNYVPDLWSGRHEEFDPDHWIDTAFVDHMGRLNCYPVSDVDEGVCVRAEGYPTPTVLKVKSPKFLQKETRNLDKGVIDIEELEAA